MKVSASLGWFLSTGPGKILPAKIMNPLYRFLINELIKESRLEANPGEILSTPPVVCNPSSGLKVATLVSSKDVEMLIWCLKSLFYFSARTWDLVVIDGGLHPKDVVLLEDHFPNVRVLLESDLTRRFSAELADFECLKELRFKRGYAPAKKIIDAPRVMQSHKFLLLDSDVLFFRAPHELVQLLEDRQERFAFSVDQLGVNSGVAVVPAGRISFVELEKVLRSMSPEKRAGWQVEQELYASLLDGRFDRLPIAYAIEPISNGGYGDLACCHFVHVCRHRFYSEGIRQLRRLDFINQLREKYASKSPALPR